MANFEPRIMNRKQMWGEVRPFQEAAISETYQELKSDEDYPGFSIENDPPNRRTGLQRSKTQLLRPTYYGRM